MFRNSFLAFAIVVATLFASSSTVQAQTPIENFRNLTYGGVIQAYYGYYYCYQAHQIAQLNGFSDADTGFVLLYAEQYALYSYQYGYYALQLNFSDYALAGAETANAAWNYEYGIYDYVRRNVVPIYPQTGVILEPLRLGYTHMLYAEIYYRYAYLAVQ